METIGQYLKSVREGKGKSIAAVSDRTKIKPEFLEFIESDKISQVGEGGYARAMVVSYARELGADVKRVCDMYDRNYAQSEPVIYQLAPKKSVGRRFMFSHRAIYAFLLVVFLAALAVVVWKLYEDGSIPLPHNFLKSEINKTQPDSTKSAPAAVTTPAPTPTPASVSTNSSAASDTTDHVNNLIFKGKSSPMNYRDH